MEASDHTTTRQVARFAAAGVINTLIDYTGFLFLVWIFHLPLEHSWIAKLASGTLAMSNSFLLNRRWVFRGTAGGASQLVRFAAVTLIGTFVVQLGGLHLLSAVWPAPGMLAFRVVELLHLDGLLPAQLVVRTVAFGAGTLASMCWNFVAYRHWVFPAPVAGVAAGAAGPAVAAGPAGAVS
jgi:putative flippase GtrA